MGAGGALRRMSNSAKLIQSFKAIYIYIIGETIHLCPVKQPRVPIISFKFNYKQTS